MESIPVVRGALYLLRDGRYPDSCESHVLYIVQVVNDSLPCATAIPSKITAGSRASIGSSIAVSKKLVDGLRTPRFVGKGRSQCKIGVQND